MAKSRIMSINSIREKKFHLVDVFDPYWTQLLGRPERNFKIAIAGPSTSGKSSLAIKLGDQLAKVWGKVLYNSWEEGHNQTIQQRAIERNVDAARLYVSAFMPFDEMMVKIKSNGYRSVIIDSVAFMGLTLEQYMLLKETYKRYKSFIFLSHADREGQFDGCRKIWKDADIKIWVNNGRAKITNRYSGETKEVELFKVKKITNLPTQGQLFDK